jgi:hypothetical protein
MKPSCAPLKAWQSSSDESQPCVSGDLYVPRISPVRMLTMVTMWFPYIPFA